MSDETPPESKGESNLTATRFLPGKSGNPGGRPNDLPRFRKKCRKKAWAWLALDAIDAQMASLEVPLGEKAAFWKAVCDRGGFSAVATDKGGGDLPSGPTLPMGLSDSINAGLGILSAQVQAILAASAQRPLDPSEITALERLTWGLSQIEQARGRLLIAALRSPDLNKDSGAALVEAFLGRPRPAPKPEGP